MKALDRITVPGHDYLDWEIIIMFYSILHLVDDHFIRNGLKKAKNHTERNHAVRKRLGRIHLKYKKLWGLSIQARYTQGRDMTSVELDRARRLYAELTAFLSRN